MAEITGVVWNTKTEISWSAATGSAAELGGTPNSIRYDTIRANGPEPADFALGECVETDGTDTTTPELFVPGVGNAAFYLVRGGNSCPSEGPLGSGIDENGAPIPRNSPACP